MTLVAEAFWEAARLQSEMHGLPGLVLLKVPHSHNTSNLPVARLKELAEEIFPNLIELATQTWFPHETISRSSELK